jgi:hypothetical protein
MLAHKIPPIKVKKIKVATTIKAVAVNIPLSITPTPFSFVSFRNKVHAYV